MTDAALALMLLPVPFYFLLTKLPVDSRLSHEILITLRPVLGRLPKPKD
jgi:hypothetical protein